MKIDFIADTNFLIYFHEGNENVESFENYRFGISIISEIELLSFQKITSTEEIQLKSLLNNCFQIELTNKIKEQTIQLKKQYPIKLPDAIIASTAIVNKVPLVTADKGFSKVKGLNLILI